MSVKADLTSLASLVGAANGSGASLGERVRTDVNYRQGRRVALSVTLVGLTPGDCRAVE